MTTDRPPIRTYPGIMTRPRLYLRKAELVLLLKKYLHKQDILFIKNLVEKKLPCTVVIPEFRINFGQAKQNVSVTQLVSPFATRTYRIQIHEISRFHSWCSGPTCPTVTDDVPEFSSDFNIVEFMYE